MTRSGTPEIPRRRLDFGFDRAALPRDWYRDDAALTLIPAALSLVFPEGERFFVESVVRFRDRLDDPDLLERVAAFAAQEGMHSKQHLAFNSQLTGVEQEIADDLERKVKVLLNTGRGTHSAAGRLAVTCALEHFTAIMAEQLLTSDELRGGFDPAVRPLWLWHALEETEHKSVALDVYRSVDGSYRRRAGVMLLTTLCFVGFITYGHFRLLRARQGRVDWTGLGRTFGHFWVHPGHFRRLVPSYLRYFLPGFHPDERDAGVLVQKWRERLFGASGALTERLETAHDDF